MCHLGRGSIIFLTYGDLCYAPVIITQPQFICLQQPSGAELKIAAYISAVLCVQWSPFFPTPGIHVLWMLDDEVFCQVMKSNPCS